jgi:hypothetical protein
MKYKLHMRTPAAIFILTASLVAAAAQPAAGFAPLVDPVTGLPITPPAHPWKDPDWKDPIKVLPEVNFDGLPISEVARYLRDQFSNNFDVMIPTGYVQKNAVATSNQVSGQPRSLDPNAYTVKLQLRNVNASEIFQAMNWEWENENNPVRWQLMMNGNRPTALLRVVPELLTHGPPPPPAPEIKRMVFFVGDLIGEGKLGDTNEPEGTHTEEFMAQRYSLRDSKISMKE